jgi:ectoine hydroxylase-related dioxygenase (phytanoyl-CoA dioxygenase family)
VLIDYRILCCNFMVKAPGGGEIQAHQDYTWVDESAHVAFNLWVPLQDTDDGNGCFHLVPGSHRFIENSYRAGTIRESLVPHNEALKAYMVPVPVPAGRGILFDHRLFHYSPDNLSDQPRVAAQLVLVPAEAQPVMAHFRPEDPGHVRLLAIDDDRYLTEKNLWDIDPSSLREVARRPFRPLPGGDELIELVRRRTAD